MKIIQLKKIALLFSFCLLNLYLFSQIKTKKNNFQSPVDFPIYLAGNFGEIRAEHFHAGIDIKTQGVEGKNIYSIDEGYISRIKISANGYGKTLYINHPSGYTSVYGHLSNLKPEINNLIKDIQYKNKEFEVDFYAPINSLKVKKGELIGFSGNTGQSSGPHLHFEIRDSKNQDPLNPLLFNFSVQDDISPVFYSLFVYPASKESLANGLNQPKFYSVEKANGDYKIIDTLQLSGRFYFGYEINDFLNDSKNRCGIYTMSILVNDKEVYLHTLDKLSFSEMAYVKSHIDYSERVRTKKTFQKTYIAPNNNLSIYQVKVSNGIFDFNTDSAYTIQFLATDVHGNRSKLLFNVKSSSFNNNYINEDTLKAKTFYWNIENSFTDENIQLVFPANTFFETTNFVYTTSEPIENSYSLVHKIHDKYTPVLKPYSISIKTINLPENLREKAIIAQKKENGNGNGNGKMISLGGDFINGYVVANSKELGDFFVLVDTIAPSIIPLVENKKFNNSDTIKFTIKDELSGIKIFNGYIDNNWALFEYDMKNDLLFYILDDQRIKKHTNHELELFVIDQKGNINTYYTSFYW